MDTFFVLWSDDPLLVLGFFAALLIAAGYFGMGAKVRVTHRHEMDAAEPVRRRVVLDATARFPPKAQDRRRVS